MEKCMPSSEDARTNMTGQATSQIGDETKGNSEEITVCEIVQKNARSRNLRNAEDTRNDMGKEAEGNVRDVRGGRNRRSSD